MAISKEEKQDQFERGQDNVKHFDPIYNGPPTGLFESEEDHAEQTEAWESGRRSILNDPNQ